MKFDHLVFRETGRSASGLVSPRLWKAMLALPIVFALTIGAASGQVAPDADEPSQSDVRSLVHILDYIAQDYQVAVSSGAVINAAEYDEMVNFGRNAEELIDELEMGGVLPKDSVLQKGIRRLRTRISEKAAANTVAAQARRIRDRVLALTDLPTAPLQWPDISKGGVNYERMCAVCHGETGSGDGRVADGLDPPPTNFLEGDRIASQSPFQIYNTIRLGVDGTAMPDFELLTEKKLWDLAFFVKSLQPDRRRGAWEQADSIPAGVETITLRQLAALNDAELAEALAEQGTEHPERAALRLRARTPEHGMGVGLQIARGYLQDALESYRKGALRESRRHALNAYLQGIEPIEPSLRARDRTLATVLEERMLDVRRSIEKESGAEVVAAAVRSAETSISDAQRLLSEEPSSLWFSFLIAASILLREGLEAFLIILAVLSVLQSLGQSEAARWVHGGWVLAALLGVAGWLYSDVAIQFGAAEREFMEGSIALLAVGVLLYVGFWLHSKTEMHRWRTFIDERVQRTLGRGNLLGLAALSFFAVFREAFESVLFLSALTLDGQPGERFAVAAGASSAIVLVLGLAALVLRYSIRLPIRSLFCYSSAVLAILCVVLLGKGIHVFQEAGLLSITTAPVSLRFDLIGLYPTAETLAAQAFLLMVIGAIWLAPQLAQTSSAAR